MKSIKQDYLTFQLVRLLRTESWLNAGLGFSFLLAKGGSGQYASKSTAQRLLPGDVLVLNSAEGGKIEAAGDELIFWRFSVCLEHFFPLFDVEEICLLHDIIENFKRSQTVSGGQSAGAGVSPPSRLGSSARRS